MRLDGSERPAGLVGDLAEGEVAEEPKRDHLAIGLVEASQSLANVGRALGAERQGCRIGSAGLVRCPAGVGRIEPRDGSPLLRSTDSDANRDPGQPGTERPVLTPRAERAEGGHECLLGRVLGFVEVTEHSMAGTNDRRALALNEDPERIAIAGKDAADDGSIVDGDVGR
jgi:hypothetical protein